MMINKKFRNHISVVAEETWKIVVFIFVIIFTAVIDNIESIINYTETSSIDMIWLTISLLAILLILVIVIIWKLIIWAKTYISINETSINIETNTIIKRKNTLLIKNISNVNIERNIFELIIGTSKLKLDTNTLSTADKTDVKIILKKNDAEKLQSFIMNLITQDKKEEIEEDLQEKIKYDIEKPEKDIIHHGILSIHIFSVIVLIISIIFGAQMILDSSSRIIEKGLIGIIFSILLIFIFFITSLWDIVKGFINYYGFKIKQNKDKLYINYGLIKRINYTVPIDKINALVLKQSFLGRISKNYMAEIVNIGINDNEQNNQTFLLPYNKQDDLYKEINRLLPDYKTVLKRNINKQPKRVWFIWIINIVIYFVLTIVGYLLTKSYFTEYKTYILLGIIIIGILIIVLKILKYNTEGSIIENKYLIISKGYLEKKIIYIPYEKIQFLELKQNIIAKKLKIQKGNIYLLASSTNRIQKIPYFEENKTNFIKQVLLKKHK